VNKPNHVHSLNIGIRKPQARTCVSSVSTAISTRLHLGTGWLIAYGAYTENPTELATKQKKTNFLYPHFDCLGMHTREASDNAHPKLEGRSCFRLLASKQHPITRSYVYAQWELSLL